MSDPKLRLVPVSSGRIELISLAHTTNHMGNSCTRLDGTIECTVCDLVAELVAARTALAAAAASSLETLRISAERQAELRGRIIERDARIAELESQIAALRGAELDARPAVEINVTDFGVVR